MSGEKRGCTEINCRSWLASDDGLTADLTLRLHASNCRSWLASDDGLTADLTLRLHASNCRSWLASDDGLPTNLILLLHALLHCFQGYTKSASNKKSLTHHLVPKTALSNEQTLGSRR